MFSFVLNKHKFALLLLARLMSCLDTCATPKKNMNNIKRENIFFEEQKCGSIPTGSENDYLPHNCKYCLYGTNTIEALKRHERSHILQKSPIRKELKPLYTCDFCNRKFVQKKELDEHKKTHAIGMACSLCDYTSSNKNALKIHVRSHDNKMSFQCLLCCERLTSRKNLDDHMNKHVLTLSSCKWCRFTTDTPSRLKAHFQVHMKTKQIQCKNCSYICFIETDMQIHKTTHEETSNESGSQSVVLQDQDPLANEESSSNMNEISLKEEKTSEENMDFFSAAHIKKLMKRAFFKCSMCGEVLNSEEGLKHHSYKHIAAQSYSCYICPFNGKNREEIMNHIMDHLPVVDLSEI